MIAATLKFVDIAGLVRGASKGEGLGNQFLANIREVDAIAHVVRCFEDENVIHVEGRIDPVGDVGTIDTELCLKDLETVDKRIERAKKAMKGRRRQGREADPRDVRAAAKRPRRGQAGARAGAHRRGGGADARHQPAHAKKVFYVANVAEKQLAAPDGDKHVARAARPRRRGGRAGGRDLRRRRGGDRRRWTQPSGRRSSRPRPQGAGLNAVARTGYKLLGLITFFTAGEDECRAWTVKRGARAPQAAGVIHTDFERGFIKAEVIWWEDLGQARLGGGLPRHRQAEVEGKDYVMRDGDVIHFRFNV